MKRILLSLLLVLVVVGVRAQSWTAPGENAYNHETVLYVSLTTNLGYDSSIEYNFIGAFIDGECRASASMTSTPVAADRFYELRVRGDRDTDEGKPITLKYCNTGKGGGIVYTLTPPTTPIFNGETQGQPSSPIKITLTAATSYTLTFQEAEVGETYDLREYLSAEPEECTLPDDLQFSVSIGGGSATAAPNAADYVTLQGYQLTALAPCEQATLTLTANGEYLTDCNFTIVQPATGISLTEKSLSVNKGDDNTLMGFLDTAYKILPEGATANVEWEVKDISIIQWIEDGSYYHPAKGGTTEMRPYFTKRDGTKVYPANDAWITITVVVPAESVSVDYDLYDGSFLANVGDTHIYERMVKMITILPEDATDKTFTISVDNPDVLTLTGQTTLTAIAAGKTGITIHPNGAANSATTGPLTETVTLTVLDPPTQITLGSNQLNVVLSNGEPQNISKQVKDNVTLNGDPDQWQNAMVSVEGDAVNATDYGFNAKGMTGTFTAVAAGTATVNISLSWPDYDSYGLTSDYLQNKYANASFTIVVSTENTLAGFDVTVEGAVAGQTGTITLMPQPKGAAFDPSAINLQLTSDHLANVSQWNKLITVSQKSASATELVYEFSSAVPDVVNVSVSDAAGTPITLNDPTAATAGSFNSFEVGWPLTLSTGWQWLSNPCGVISTNSLEETFSGNLIEIRTQGDLLYNDPSWGYYGTLANTAGLLQGQCYKLKMKSGRNAVLYGSSVTDAASVFGVQGDNRDITITLKPGWNWVGNPYLFDRKIETVLPVANFADGTIIVGKEGSAELGHGSWQGNISTLNAGQGYLIKNPATGDKQLVFKSELTMTPANESAAGARAMGMSGNVWSYDHSQFMNNMTMVAVLDGVDQAERFSIGAFVGDECRGSGVVIDGKAFITVHCDAGERVSFRLYDTATGTYGNVAESLKAQTRVGSLTRPYVLHADFSAQGIETVRSEELGVRSYDLSGRSVSSSKHGLNIRRNADGSYRKVITH